METETIIKNLQAYICGVAKIDTLDAVAIINKLRELEKELAELRENAIVPKFNLNQEVWFVSVMDTIISGRILQVITHRHIRPETWHCYSVQGFGVGQLAQESELFATEAEAQASLKTEGAK
jgi:hypothetical protein